MKLQSLEPGSPWFSAEHPALHRKGLLWEGSVPQKGTSLYASPPQALKTWTPQSLSLALTLALSWASSLGFPCPLLALEETEARSPSILCLLSLLLESARILSWTMAASSSAPGPWAEETSASF